MLQKKKKHANDAAAHLRDIFAYDEAVGVVVDFARERGDTLVVSLSDHETGGMSLGRNVGTTPVYDWKPDVLHRVLASNNELARRTADAEDWRETLVVWAGIAEPTEAEVERIEAVLAGPERTRVADLVPVVRDMINERALIGWTTNGHTAVDVHVFAFGPGRDAFRGHHTNAEIGQLLARAMGLQHAAPGQ